ncbi:MAG: iron-sulfur cluster carrier protein ApbC [Nitrospinota bacterium]|jgi:ATP-binding protein involved in chromosome partitioning|nr:iron-sulfur cluster carrier protein ApbC [Nitrospinota bacterium]HJM44232.1 iron-sulfur cluster carrier protein ApbC [Nitrospinota bacterium]
MANPSVTEEQVLDALRGIRDPDLNRDIVTLGFVKDLSLDGSGVSFTIELTTPTCPVKEEMQAQAERLVGELAGVERASVRMTARVPPGRATADRQAIPGVKNIVAVASGKGGVGKSTVAVNLAVSIAKCGAAVGLMDSDIFGPSVPLMMNIAGQPRVAEGNRILPMQNYGVKVISMGLLLGDRDDTPVIWRGPMVMQAVTQFVQNVEWGALDYLIVDMPPGTGDAHLTLTQRVPLTGAVIVTTPQDIALLDAKKGLQMFNKVETPILGIIENMSYFLCPHCGERSEIFGYGGGQRMAGRYEVPFLGEIPLDVRIREHGDEGRPIVYSEPESANADAFRKAAAAVAARVSMINIGEGTADSPDSTSFIPLKMG